MTTSPQDDLTAERAAQLYNSLHAYIPTDRCVYASELNQVELEKVEDITKLTAALKTARHEALREAAKVVETITLQAVKAELRWRKKHAAEEVEGVAKSERAECYMRSLGLHIKGELDRLASEGA